MRKTFTVLLSAVLISALMYGCSQDFGEENPEPATRADADNGDDDSGIPEGLYYDEESGMWLIPANDLEDAEPSAAEPAISTMSMGGFTPTPSPGPGDFTPGQVRWFTITTHNYLKIWPKDEDQIEELFSLENVVVQYHSFESLPLPTSVMQSLRLTNSAPSAQFARYSETIEVLESTDGILGSEVVYMPVLYAMWPIGFPIPEYLDYEITGQRTEKVSFETPSSGTPPPPASGGEPGVFIPVLKILAWDSTLGKHVRVPNVLVHVRSAGGRVVKGFTDAYGTFSCKSKYHESSEVQVTVSWDHKHFWLESNCRQGEYVATVKLVGNCEVKIPECHHSTIFRAAEYWFAAEREHGLRTSCGSSGKVWIRAYDCHNDGENGIFYTYVNSRGKIKTAIKVWRNRGRSWTDIFCTTMHEMGHGSMYAYKGKIDFWRTGGRVKETWASFTGWYLTNHAYASWGYRGGWNLGDTRQGWNKMKAGAYSPILIDLFDDENQKTVKKNKPNEYGNSYNYIYFPNDNIKNVPVWVIQDLAFNTKDYWGLKWRARRQIGTYYTTQQFEDYFSIYDETW